MAPPEGQKPQDDLTVAPAPAGATAFASADPDLTVPVAPDLTDRGARTTEPPGRRISLAAWLIGRGWTVTALALDAAMLLLGMAAAFVGAGHIGAQVERRLDEHRELGLEPVGYVDAHPPSDDQVQGRRAPILPAPRMSVGFPMMPSTRARRCVSPSTSRPPPT